MNHDIDLDLIKKSKEGDIYSQEILLQKYKNLVKSIANKYHIKGADKEDILQEGMIGLYKAIRDYDIDKNVYFNIFARKCIARQIITAVRNANRQKNKPLNEYLSFDDINIEEDYEKFIDEENPETIFIRKEQNTQLNENLKKILTRREYLVLNLFLKGYSHKEISKKLGITVRGTSGAIQRVKYKLLTRDKKIL